MRYQSVFQVLAGVGMLAVGLAGGCADAHTVARDGEQLVHRDSLKGWHGTRPDSQWRVVSDVTMGTADDADKLLITPLPAMEVGQPAAAVTRDGILANGETGKTCNLVSDVEHGDCELHVEFMVPRGSNSGVYLQGRYEIQILDSHGKDEVGFGDCGGIYSRWINNANVEGHAPRVNAARPPGEWQSFDIVFQAPRFDDAGRKVANARFVKVAHNGVVVHKDVELNGPTRAAMDESREVAAGPLMLQGDHGPVAYRHIRILRK